MQPMGSKGYCLFIVSHSSVFSLRKELWSTGQNLGLTTSHLSYCIPGILALGANDLDIGTPFANADCLQLLSGLSASI